MYSFLKLLEVFATLYELYKNKTSEYFNNAFLFQNNTYAKPKIYFMKN
jgi:hypothetical protein